MSAGDLVHAAVEPLPGDAFLELQREEPVAGARDDANRDGRPAIESAWLGGRDLRLGPLVGGRARSGS